MHSMHRVLLHMYTLSALLCSGNFEVSSLHAWNYPRTVLPASWEKEASAAAECRNNVKTISDNKPAFLHILSYFSKQITRECHFQATPMQSRSIKKKIKTPSINALFNLLLYTGPRMTRT